MKNLLFLAHRFPYPPNKGDKIRSYHLLKHLAESYKIYLGTFIDDQSDWQFESELAKLCRDICIRPLNPMRARMRSLSGFLNGKALSLPYYYDSVLADWVRRVITEKQISHALIFSSPMAQYLLGDPYTGIRRIADFVDVDSDKWRQYSSSKTWPMGWLYQREAEYLEKYEIAVTEQFDASLFVSPFEADMFRSLAPALDGKIDYFNNGVDTRYFSPAVSLPNPYPEGSPVLVFTGLMDYWANIDAVSWFVNEVFPTIRAAYEDARFYIVGANPTSVIRSLERYQGVVVTGKVPDVRPYILHAAISVAPLRIARGVQNKVLEAMAMAKPVVATTAATRGIGNDIGPGCSVVNTAQEFAASCLQLLKSLNRTELGQHNRRFVEEHYEWTSNLRRVDIILDSSGQSARRVLAV